MTFDELEPSELASWLERTRSRYISERTAAGDTPAEASAHANSSVEKTFPGGLPGPGQMIGWLSYGGVRVGQLWIGPLGEDPHRYWVWDVIIDETERGRGLGRKAMLLAEDLAVANGGTSIGLNVFGHNTVARTLYRSLGYEETSMQMRKALSPEEPRSNP